MRGLPRRMRDSPHCRRYLWKCRAFPPPAGWSPPCATPDASSAPRPISVTSSAPPRARPPPPPAPAASEGARVWNRTVGGPARVDGDGRGSGRGEGVKRGGECEMRRAAGRPLRLFLSTVASVISVTSVTSPPPISQPRRPHRTHPRERPITAARARPRLALYCTTPRLPAQVHAADCSIAPCSTQLFSIE